MRALATLESRLSPWKLGAIAFVLLCFARGATFADPPYWDALMGAFPQGLWLAEHDFDWWRLVHEPVFIVGGPNVYPFSVYPWIVGALYATPLAPKLVFVVLHVVNAVCAAVAAGAVYSVARRRLPAPTGLLATLVLVTAPLFQSLTCQMNMDMPLLAFTALSFAALDAKEPVRAAAWSLAALLVKYTAVIGIGASLVVCIAVVLRPSACGLDGVDRRAWKRGAWLHAALLLLFVAEVAFVALWAKAPAFLDPVAAWKNLFLRRIWTMPEYGLVLVLFLAHVPWIVRRMRDGRARWIEVQCAAFLVAFVAFYCLYSNTLPRYFLQSEPFLVAWIVARMTDVVRGPRARVAWLAAAIGFHVVNTNGRFYPSRPSGWTAPGVAGPIPGNDGYILERSMEYRDDLELDLELAEALERFPHDHTVIVANWPLLHLLTTSDLGYVSDEYGPNWWRTSSPDVPLLYDARAVPYGDLYERTTPPRKKTKLDVIWALTPNTFSGPQTSLLLDVDDVIRFEHAGRYAFLVHRRGWE